MRITIAIDFANGETVAVHEHDIEDKLLDQVPYERIGARIGGIIGGYLESRRAWLRKSDIEKMLLIEHDKRTGYKGGAPAGGYNEAWGFREIQCRPGGTICIPLVEVGTMKLTEYSRMASDADVIDGRAVWCMGCANAECRFRGQDLLVICEHCLPKAKAVHPDRMED